LYNQFYRLKHVEYVRSAVLLSYVVCRPNICRPI